LSEYSLKKPLPSCTVDKTLLQELEDYLHKKVSEAIPPTEDEKASGLSMRNYHLTIEDSFGEETIKSAIDIDRSYFPDDTKAIRLEYRARNKDNRIDIKITFSASSVLPEFSELKITFQGASSREFVTGLAHQIIHRLEPYKTNSRYFSITLGKFLFAAFLFAISLVGISYGLEHSTSLAKFFLTSSVSFLILVIAWVILLFLKPYSKFNTRRNEQFDKWINWVFAGVLAFILFTVVGVYFRQKLLGF